MPDSAKALSNAERDLLIGLRRDIHAHPELGFEEERTSAIVRDLLEKAGVEVTTGLGKTGLVGTIRAGASNKAIALRADMDALAMDEMASESDRPYKSVIPGRMHACGHDGHTVMLLGAALRLAKSRKFDGTVHFVFQPAEEGRGRARAMIEDGLFERFPVDAMYGLHNMPGIDPDSMAIVAGPQLAASDRWEVVFEGVGTHGAKPHWGRDAPTVAGYFLTAVHTIAARLVDPIEPAVVSVCAIEGGNFEALNVIPDKIRIGGTARSYSPQVRDTIEVEIGKIARGLGATWGVKALYDYKRGVSPVINDAAVSARAVSAARVALGEDKVLTEFPPTTAGEDFSCFMEKVPSTFVWLGNGPAADDALHHNSRYDFNDEAIGTGVAFWTTLVEQELRA